LHDLSLFFFFFSFLQGVLLEKHDARAGHAIKALLQPNFAHACLELVDPGGAAPAPQASRCLRSVGSLEEALQTLRGLAGEATRAAPSVSPIKSQQPTTQFSSPSKPPLRRGAGVDALREGVELVGTCASAQLREGCAMLQGAAGDPAAAAACVRLGAIGALVAAAATVLPNNVMGTTEQLSLIALTLASVMDAAPASEGAQASTVAALSAALRQPCANPTLLCKVALALLQRPDVRAEAMRQGLADSFAKVYCRISPLLEPLARKLLSASGPAALQHAALASNGIEDNAAETAPPLRRREGGGAGAKDRAAPIGGSNGAPAPVNAVSLPGQPGPRVPRLVFTTRAGSGSESDLPALGRPSIPKLTLPGGSTSTPPSSGLTRATRRERRSGGTTPGGGGSTPGRWGTPRRSGELGTPRASAYAEMAALAAAVGECTMARDLPAIIDHKRRADILVGAPASEDNEEEEEEAGASGSGEDGGAPRDPMEPAVAQRMGGAQVQAHRILMTARSIRSEESSVDERQTLQSGPTAGGARLQPLGGPQTGDVVVLKCQLLQGVLQSLPILQTGEGRFCNQILQAS
jgi:hypothetical protein